LKVAALVPVPTFIGAFDYLTAARLPDAPGCYVLTNAGSDIIYLGQAVSLRSRLLQHVDTGRHRELTSYGRASLLSILQIEDPLRLNAHERGWLNQCLLCDGTLPPLNKVEAPI
jgi:hypothetical protein